MKNTRIMEELFKHLQRHQRNSFSRFELQKRSPGKETSFYEYQCSMQNSNYERLSAQVNHMPDNN